MQFSQQQEKVFEVALAASVNIMVEAVAGSGKTTTIKEMVRRYKAAYPNKTIVCTTFARKVAEGLKNAVSDIAETGTMNSICNRVWTKFVGHFVDPTCEYKRNIKALHELVSR